jgi:hypothetical protein
MSKPTPCEHCGDVDRVCPCNDPCQDCGEIEARCRCIGFCDGCGFLIVPQIGVYQPCRGLGCRQFSFRDGKTVEVLDG